MAECIPLLEISFEPIQSKVDSKIEVFINDKLINDFRPYPKISTYYFDLDETIFNRSNTLKFQNNIFASPQSLNMGNDNRLLSIRLYYFKLSCK